MEILVVIKILHTLNLPRDIKRELTRCAFNSGKEGIVVELKTCIKNRIYIYRDGKVRRALQNSLRV